MLYDIFIQLIGFIAMALCILCYQLKDSRRLLLCQMAGDLCFALQYILLGGFVGCLTEIICAACNYVITNNHKKKFQWKGWPWFFSILIVAICIITWKSFFDILVVIASVTAIFTNWTRNGKTIRLGKLFVVGPFWMSYNLYVGSYGGLITDVLSMLSVVISVIRFGIKDFD